MATRTLDAAARQRMYVRFGVAIAIWSAVVLWFAVEVVPLDVYWMSYYSATYTHGFVRRGLAGELAGLAPGHYFGVALGLRWLSTAVYLGALATVAAVALRRGARSERSLLVVMLIPLLPFGIPFATYSARPDLFGAAALALFAAGLALFDSHAAAMASCLLFGAAMAVLTLVHEAVGLQFALGAVLAIVVLGEALQERRGVAVLLAVAPGVATASAVAAFGRHDVASRLCSSVPHQVMPNPFATVTSPSTLARYVFTGPARQTDYHDWVCRNVMPSFDHGIVEAIHSVGHVGVVGLTMSLLFGAIAVAVTMWGISTIASVPLRAFFEALRGRTAWAVAGLLLIVPVFLTGYDWTRWLTIVAFNAGVVLILFVTARPEITRGPTSKALRVFAALVLALALIPLGTVPGFGGPLMV